MTGDSKTPLIAYWLATALLSLANLAGGYFDLAQPEELGKIAAQLGYPLYVFTILGVWKVGGAIVIVLPGLPRLKEWAYAGIVFDLTGAIASHVFVGDSVSESMPALALLALTAASWALRPASRRLPGAWV